MYIPGSIYTFYIYAVEHVYSCTAYTCTPSKNIL